MRFTLLLGIGLFFGLAGPLLAQPGGAASGTVVDGSGAVVPGATVTLTGPAGRQVTASGPAGEYQFRSLAAGAYQVSVSLAGFATATRDIVVGGIDVTVPPITLALAGIGEVVVVSATKVESKLVDAPATMTVISSETLASTPAQNYGDVLRSVPGVNVIQTSARDINVTSREATSTLANSQLTLLDGRSIYLDFFGLILWDFVPTNPSDIKQIEVVRGPASAIWGANALTGVVNIITRSPREAAGALGTNLTLTGGVIDRDASPVGQSLGTRGSYGASFSTNQAPNDRWSYRVAGGFYHSDALPRPVGRVPPDHHPLDPSEPVGGGIFPPFTNSPTNQPKLDLRVDQEAGGGGRLTYSAGIAGTKGIVHTGIGPFDLRFDSEKKSYMGYGKVGYVNGAFKLNAFANLVDAEAPNLLSTDLQGVPILLRFKTQTYDLEAGHSVVLGGKHTLSYGGNARRNIFDISIAPNAKDRTELGAYFQDEVFFNQFRFVVGGRVDKFGNLTDPVFSPRI